MSEGKDHTDLVLERMRAEEGEIAPVVSILTPVHNGEAYLHECIESVIAQSFQDWEYVIVDNCSTDRTLEIARHYADLDKRIRIETNLSLLNVAANFNRALLFMHPDSKYCKFVCADDTITPDCVELMVGLAERYPSVGLVSSLRILGDWIDPAEKYHDRIPEVMSGREACRRRLLGGLYLFGSSTTTLLRTDAVREHRVFFDETSLHSDAIASFRMLQTWDFGFKKKVLSFTRLHDASVTAAAVQLGSGQLVQIQYLVEFGPKVLDPEEYDRCESQRLRRYYRYLGRALLSLRGKKFWAYHRNNLSDLGFILRPLAVVQGAFFEILRVVAGAIRKVQSKVDPEDINTIDEPLKSSDNVPRESVLASKDVACP